MEEGERGYLLRIRDGGRVVAEAPLLIHDAEATWRLFSEGFGMMVHMVAGSFYNAVRVGCHPELLAKVGPQVALNLETKSKIAVPTLDGLKPE